MPVVAGRRVGLPQQPPHDVGAQQAHRRDGGRRRGDGRVGQAELASVDGMDMVLAPRFRERDIDWTIWLVVPVTSSACRSSDASEPSPYVWTISRAEPTRVTWKTELPSPSAYVRPIVTVS